jgi:3-methyladenine DNA glycosylase AlkD
MSICQKIKAELNQNINPEKASFYPRFFKTGAGEYGEGDVFIGVTVPHQRKVARKYYQEISLKELGTLLKDPIHEYRMTALLILVEKYAQAREEEKHKELVDFYLKHLPFVNNWDLVDASADKILGAYLLHKDKKILYDLARSQELWKQRTAIIATFYFIKNNSFQDTLALAKIFLDHPHDLIHKAVGWMLREVGKRDFVTAVDFLTDHYQDMPRTMLRYAIEKFEPELRQRFLKGLI